MRKSMMALFLTLSILASMVTPVSAATIEQDPDLAAHWKFDEGSGTIAADSSGNGFTGTLSTSNNFLPEWTPGKDNGGIQFDGSTNYVDIGTDLRDKLNGASALTISVWVKNISKPVASDDAYTVFMSCRDGASAGLSVSFTKDGVRLAARSKSGDGFIYITAPYDYNTMNGGWHHIVGMVSFANKNMQIFIDGELAKIQTSRPFGATIYTPGTSKTRSDTIGREISGKFYNGELDELMIYRKALTKAQISELYEKGKNAQPGNPTGNPDNDPIDIIPVVNQDIIGEVYGFDGAHDYINIGHGLRNDLSGSSAVTVSAWVYSGNLPENNKKEVIFTNKINGSDSGAEMYLSDFRLKVGGRSTPSDPYQIKEVAFEGTNTWHYLVGILDYANDEIRIYIDGDLMNRTDKNVNFSSSVYTPGTYVTRLDNIGRDSTGNSYFKGSMRNLMISDRALSDEEIRNAAGPVNPHRIRPLAEEFTTIYRAENGQAVFTGNPGIVRCPNGRLIASYTINDGSSNTGRMTVSDDGGVTWNSSELIIPFIQARFFVAGDALYALGRKTDLMIMKSTDWGDTWGPAVKLTEGQNWESSVNTVVYKNGYVYTTIERRIYQDTVEGTTVNALAPVLLRGNVTDDLTDPSKWTYASELAFRDAVSKNDLDFFGVPVYDYYENPYNRKLIEGSDRYMSAMGWLETSVVQINDPKSYLYDPSGKTLYLISRSNNGAAGYANILKVVENEDGTMTTSFVTTPSGRKMLFIPFPGGQMKFYIIYDEVTNLYWMASTQATDSMTHPGKLAGDRFDLPSGERRRLQLSYSKNLMDWVFAGIVAMGPTNAQSRHYASIAIDGDDMLIISRSGDSGTISAHDGNIITLHNVKNFRSLVYSTNSAFVEDTADEAGLIPAENDPAEGEEQGK